jgi:hydroxymethylbilane synthase
LDTTLDAIGGKGLFVKELEVAMLEGRADIAVHSMKDVPVELPEGLHLAAISERAAPGDALVPRDGVLADEGTGLERLPSGSRVGSSSLRRKCQLSAIRPDLDIADIRGNVGTRLSKLDAGEFDALVLATAGLERMALEHRIGYEFDYAEMLPAGGQGAMGVECRQDDEAINQLLARIHDARTAACVAAEREMNVVLGGGCHAPIAAFAVHIDSGSMSLTGLVGRVDGAHIIKVEQTGSANDALLLGRSVAVELRERGADQVLSPYLSEPPGQS